MMPPDSNRFVWAKLADPAHRMPMPGRGEFPAEGKLVDLFDPFVQSLLAGGSLVRSAEPVKPDEQAKPADPSEPAEEPKATEAPKSAEAPPSEAKPSAFFDSKK